VFAAVVLAGGAARRMGGVDKPAQPVHGLPMLDRVLAAVVCARPRVVVGPPRPHLAPDVVSVREDPPGGGPVAAAMAGLSLVLSAPGPPRFTTLLAADLPFLDQEAVETLLAHLASGTAHGAVYVDGAGRRQWLCGAWRTTALAARLLSAGTLVGASMRQTMAGLTVIEVATPPGGRPPWFDCDTKDDLRSTEEW
jgi:molybdopterin-guanine dinucleotide biosynthesis protein A